MHGILIMGIFGVTLDFPTNRGHESILSVASLVSVAKH